MVAPTPSPRAASTYFSIGGALLQGYKYLIMSYIWINQQHNGANGLSTPLNMSLFLRIYDNNQSNAREERKKEIDGMGGTCLDGETAPSWGIVPPIPSHVRYPCPLW